MQKDQQKLAQLIQGKKVAFIGAGVSHKTLIKEFVELGALFKRSESVRYAAACLLRSS